MTAGVNSLKKYGETERERKKWTDGTVMRFATRSLSDTYSRLLRGLNENSNSSDEMCFQTDARAASTLSPVGWRLVKENIVIYGPPRGRRVHERTHRLSVPTAAERRCCRRRRRRCCYGVLRRGLRCKVVVAGSYEISENILVDNISSENIMKMFQEKIILAENYWIRK